LAGEDDGGFPPGETGIDIVEAQLSDQADGGQDQDDYHRGQHPDEQHYHNAQKTIQKTGPYGNFIFHDHIVFPNKVLKKEPPPADSQGYFDQIPSFPDLYA
jgi:hypothetical protein